MGRSISAILFWLTMALVIGEELPGEAGDGDSGGGNLLSKDTACKGVTISLEEKVKAVEMQEFNISLTVSSSSSSSGWLLSVTPSWNGLRVLDGGQLKAGSGEEEEWVITMVGKQFFLYTIKVECEGGTLASFEVAIGRGAQDSTLAVVFQRVGFLIMAVAMFMMGCEMDATAVIAYLRRPLAPALGMICQYLLMPMAAYLVGLLLLREHVWARYGLILIGCCPGGTGSNFWTALFGGDINLSITMTFCSTLASFGMTTFWLWFFAKFVLPVDAPARLPYLQLLVSLVSLVVPVVLGMVLTSKRPDLSKRVMRSTRPFLVIILVTMAVLGTYTNRYFFSVVSWFHIVAPLILGFFGYVAGSLMAWMACLNRKQIVAVSLETAMQNVGIAILVLQSNLESPYGDMALLSVIGYLLSSMGPINLFVFAIFKSAELVRRNCLMPSSDEQANPSDLQENKSRPVDLQENRNKQGGDLQDIPSANEDDLPDGRGSWSEAKKHQVAKNWEGGEVYDNRVFSTNE